MTLEGGLLRKKGERKGKEGDDGRKQALKYKNYENKRSLCRHKRYLCKSCVQTLKQKWMTEKAFVDLD